jgi:hypothetical protein
VIVREKYDSTGDEEDEWEVTLPCSVQEQQENTMRDTCEEKKVEQPRQFATQSNFKAT